MSSFKLTGTIKQIGSEIQITDKFKKREIVVTDSEGMYPQHITFQVTQDKCSILDQFSEGQEVEISFNLDGKEYTDKNTGEIKHFNSLNCWRIEAVGSAMPPAKAFDPLAEMDVPADKPAKAKSQVAEDDQDLPF